MGEKVFYLNTRYWVKFAFYLYR